MSDMFSKGSPRTFQCRVCRGKKAGQPYGSDAYYRCADHGGVWAVKLTGRTKSVRLQHGDVSYEYECQDCGHVGWSAHYDLAWKAKREGMEHAPR